MNLHLLMAIMALCSLQCATATSAQATEPADSIRTSYTVPTDTVQETYLGEITVSASTVTAMGNVQTFLVTDEMRRNTVSSIELMDRLPGFTVDPITESVRAGSRGDVKVIVNGEEVSEAYFRSINPDRIRKFELITNSSGKFSQYPAVLNIVLKNTYEGLDLSVGGRWLQGLTESPADKEAVTALFSAAYRKWEYFISGDFSHTLGRRSMGRELTLADGMSLSTPRPPRSHPGRSDNLLRGTANAGVTLRLSDRQTITGQFLYDRSGNRSSQKEETVSPAGAIRSDMDGRYDADNYVAGVTYRNTPSDAVSLQADLTYNAFRSRESQTSWLSVSPGESMHMRQTADKDYLSGYAQADVALGSNLSLTGVYQYTWRRYSSHDPGDVRASHTEDRHRPDLTLNFRSGRFSGNAGVSFLHVSARRPGESWSRASLLPRVTLRWEPLRDLGLDVQYYSMTEYPGFDLLSAQRWMVSDRVWKTGNHDLRPETMHYLEARVTFLRHFTATYMYRRSGDDISQVYMPANIGGPCIVQTYANSRLTHQYAGIQYSRDFPAGVSVDMTGSYQWYRRAWDGSRGTGRTWYLDASARWDVLGSGYMLGASVFLRDDRRPIPDGMETSHEQNLVLSGTKLFLDNRLMVSVGVNLPFRILPRIDRTAVATGGFRYEVSEDVTNLQAGLVMVSLRYVLSKGRSARRDAELRFEKERY